MENCGDTNCPFHGKLKTRGQVLEGKVLKDKAKKTVTVESDYNINVSKYERSKRKRSRIMAHNPACIAAKIGDRVRIAECKKISKNKNFVVIEKIGEKDAGDKQ